MMVNDGLSLLITNHDGNITWLITKNAGNVVGKSWKNAGNGWKMVGTWLEPDQLTWKSTYWMATPIQLYLQL